MKKPCVPCQKMSELIAKLRAKLPRKSSEFTTKKPPAEEAKNEEPK